MAKDEKKNDLNSSLLLFAGLGVHSLLSLGLRKFVVTPVRESEWARRFLNLLTPRREPRRTDTFLSSSISDVYESLQGRASLYSRLGILTHTDRDTITRIATQVVEDLNEYEVNFISKVVRKMDRGYFESYLSDSAKLQARFKQLVNEGLSINRVLRFVLSEELINLESAKELVAEGAKIFRGAITLGDIATVRGASDQFPHRDAARRQHGLETSDADEIRRKMQRYAQPRYVSHGDPYMETFETPKVRDRSLEYRTIMQVGPRSSIFSKPNNLADFLESLRRTRADQRVYSFFSDLDSLLKIELGSKSLEGRISYSLDQRGANALTGVVEVEMKDKPPLRLRIPISSGGIVTTGSSQWVLLESMDIPSMLRSMNINPRADVYSNILTNMRRRFGSIVWGQHGAGNYEYAQQKLTDLIEGPLQQMRQLYTGQPLLPYINKTISALGAIESRNFGNDLIPRDMVYDRIRSMEKMRLWLALSKNKPRLPGTYIGIDFETFKSIDQPHSVSLIVFKNGQPVDVYSSDISPQSPSLKKARGQKDYLYPESDLGLSFPNQTPQQVSAKLNAAPNIDDVAREVSNFIATHTRPGEKVAMMAFNADFEQKILGRYFYGVRSMVSSWIDPHDMIRGFVPGVTTTSLSLQNIAREMKIITDSAVSNTYIFTVQHLKYLRSNPHFLKLLVGRGDSAAKEMALKIMRATKDELETLAISPHTSAADVITANEVLVNMMREVGERGPQIHSELTYNLSRLRRGYRGMSSIQQAYEAVGGHAGPLSVSIQSALSGKSSQFDITRLAPLQWLGADPTRPLLQKFMGAPMIRRAKPALITDVYAGIADKMGDLFGLVTVRNVINPLTMNESGIISHQTAQKMSSRGFPHEMRIPVGKDIRLHNVLADLLEELEHTTPERRESVIRGAQKKIQRGLSRGSRLRGWIAPGAPLTDPSSRKVYKTKPDLYTVLQNIEYNATGEEVILKFTPRNDPGIRSAPIKTLGAHKGMVTTVLRLRGGFDAILNENIGKRSRIDAISGHVNRVAANLQALWDVKSIRKTPEFQALMDEFISETRLRTGMSITPKKTGKLQFIVGTGSAEIQDTINMVQEQELFSRKGYISYMRKFSHRIRMLRKRYGLPDIASPVLPYWTQKSIDEYMRGEHNALYGDGKWEQLDRGDRDAIRKSMQAELREKIRQDPLGQDLTERELRHLTNLRVGALRAVELYGGHISTIHTVLMGPAFEQSELYNKGTMIRIPHIDSLVIQGKAAKDIAKYRTPEQQDLWDFYRASYPHMMYGQEPRGDFPAIKAMSIKIPELEKSHKALFEYLRRGDAQMVIKETGEVFSPRTGPPSNYVDSEGNLKPGYTKEVINATRYMHAHTLTEVFGATPRFVDFNLGSIKERVLFPSINQVSATAAPPIPLSTGDIYQIVQKEHQLLFNLKQIQDSYRIAEDMRDEAKMEARRNQFKTKLNQYRHELAMRKVTFLNLINPEIPGIQGKAAELFYPGMEGILGDAKHLISGFGVQRVSYKEMEPKYFTLAMEAQKLPEGDYIGGTGKKYKTLKDFHEALLSGQDLLVMDIIRRPAESSTAWYKTLVEVVPEGRGGIQLHLKEQIMTHYDVDGDIAAMIINTAKPEELEELVKNMVLGQKKEREKGRALFDRAKSLEGSIRNYETTTDMDSKKALHTKIKDELADIKKISGPENIYPFAEGLYVRTPLDVKDETLITMGRADRLTHIRMNLRQFDPGLSSDVLLQMRTTVKEQMEGTIAQAFTKTITPAAFGRAHFLRMALQESRDPKSMAVKGILDKFYGKTTQFKKYGLEEAENIADAMTKPDSPSALRTIGKIMAEEMKTAGLELEDLSVMTGAVRNLNMRLGEKVAKDIISGTTRSRAQSFELSRLFMEGPQVLRRELPEHFYRMPPRWGAWKEKAMKHSYISFPIIAGIATLFFRRGETENEQRYEMPRSTNVTPFKFSSRTHIQNLPGHLSPRRLPPSSHPREGLVVGPYPQVHQRDNEIAFNFR